MEDQKARAELLRRRITLYREYLRQGVASELASQYLREIIAGERELERISDDRRCPPAN
jgi:hypothetical protein